MPKPYNPQDRYFKKAKEEGYKARSAFKLQEIQEKFRVMRPGDTILDLGAAPGSFLQYVSKVIGPKGNALGVDLQEIKLNLANVKTEVCDIYDNAKVDGLIKRFSESKSPAGRRHRPGVCGTLTALQKFDVILSDLAPRTSGVKNADQWKSVELCMQVVEIAQRWLKPHGNLVMKIFQGADFDEFLRETKKKFKTVKITKPKAVRDRSFEVYLVCIDYQIKFFKNSTAGITLTPSSVT